MEFRLPTLEGVAEWSGGADVSEAEIARWLVEDGARVEEGAEVLEVTLDKANVTVEAPAAGTLRQSARPGDIVAPGDVVGSIEA